MGVPLVLAPLTVGALEAREEGVSALLDSNFSNFRFLAGGGLSFLTVAAVPFLVFAGAGRLDFAGTGSSSFVGSSVDGTGMEDSRKGD